jgi:D-alanyl-D-alanine carboxypeptidase (penicillin-binding protein 5/6)
VDFPRIVAALLFVVALGPGLAAAQDLVPLAPSAVLVDQLTGRVLFQKQPDLPIPPASLTKLMTLHLTWKALASGQVHPEDPVPVTAETTGKAVPPGSSLMFLEPGQRVTVKELMLGLAVDSGNDAGMTLARFLAGSQDAFVASMNAEAGALGLTRTVFFDAFGYDARNRTTAGDFSRFCRTYLAQHPQSVEFLHNVRDLDYPLAANQAPGDKKKLRTIHQTHRNTLLGAYPGADGLKTGYIDESGYNLAATAQRGGQRLVAVILGIKARTTAEGDRLRTASGTKLLDFGFQHYPLRPLPLPEVRPVRVWFSQPGTLVPVAAGPTVFPLDDAEASTLKITVEQSAEVEGPVAAGTVLGTVIWSAGGKELHRAPLQAAQEAGPAPWWVGLWDRTKLFFRGLTGKPAPKPVSNRTGS